MSREFRLRTEKLLEENTPKLSHILYRVLLNFCIRLTMNEKSTNYYGHNGSDT